MLSSQSRSLKGEVIALAVDYETGLVIILDVLGLIRLVRRTLHYKKCSSSVGPVEGSTWFKFKCHCHDSRWRISSVTWLYYWGTKNHAFFQVGPTFSTNYYQCSSLSCSLQLVPPQAPRSQNIICDFRYGQLRLSWKIKGSMCVKKIVQTQRLGKKIAGTERTEHEATHEA